MLKKEARQITGGLSKPSKMPGPAYNLPAWHCQTGAKLRKIEGTPCFGCYAMKGRYRFSNVRAALERRLQALEDPRWVDAMITLIKGQPWFRWHDSGDIQSQKHLENIFEVCKQTPDTRHWLPTQERQYLPADPATVPDNLIIRLSGSKVDGPAPKAWPWTSSVVTSPEARTCPAPTQSNECKDCRACWDRSTPDVAYGKH